MKLLFAVNSLNPGRLAVALTLFAALAAHAQSTNGAETNPPPARIESAPVKLDESSFRIVSERNIFNANRSGGTVRSASSRRPARVETFALVGTMAYEKGAFAFFEGSSSEFTKALKPDGVIAGYKLVDILANGVKLEMDGQVMELAIGSGLRREDQGAWKVSEMAAVETGSTGSGGSSESANRYSRNGRSRRGGDSSSERSTESGSSSPASSSTASNADQSEILKRLMERREKEK